MKFNNVEEFECVICHKMFLRATKPRPGRRTKVNIRGVGSKTCRKLCARELVKRTN